MHNNLPLSQNYVQNIIGAPLYDPHIPPEHLATTEPITIESNIIGFYNLMEACRHNPVEHLVYASSSSVYGGNKKL